MKRLVRAKLAKLPVVIKQAEAISFADFIREHWDLVEPRELIWEPHMDQVCIHLEAAARGDITRLLMNVPPGLSKSTLVSVFWPAWIWTFDPGRKFMFASYSQLLAIRDAVRMRTIVDSPRYQARWGVLKNPDTWSASLFVNRANGFRFSGPTGGQFTGQHADIQVVDDPIKPYDIINAEGGDATAEQLEANATWWNVLMTSRLISQVKSVRVIIMQRLVNDDLSGEMLKGTDPYVHLCLPMEYEPEHHCTTPFGGDWRKEKGELLAPIRFPFESVRKLEAGLGVHAPAQLQQRPLDEKGTLFKLEWFTRRHTVVPARAMLIQSWDARFMEDGSRGDFVCGQVWAAYEASYYLVYQLCERLSFTETCDAIELVSSMYPKALTKLLENKANGPAIANALKKRYPGIILVEPNGSKVARAQATQPLWRAGNVSLPDSSIAPWVAAYIVQHLGFPRTRNDDQVDCTSQALNYLYEIDANSYVEALKKVTHVQRNR